MSEPLFDKMQQLMAKYQTPLPPVAPPPPSPPTTADELPVLTDLVRLGDAAPQPHTDATDSVAATRQPTAAQPAQSVSAAALDQMAHHIMLCIETRLHDEFQPLAHALVRQAVDDALSESLHLMQEQIATLVRASVRDTLHEHGISVHTDQQPV
ncbi:MAG: hypothetical protein M0T86_02455 [Betaproteobacteria bacterium]|nr:hypothetical protein [Betaproteobacteria bacterium]